MIELFNYKGKKIRCYLFVLVAFPVLFSFSQETNNFFRIDLNAICSILIPNEMEIQSGTFLERKNNYINEKIPCYEVYQKKIIAQPKGINDGTISASWNYARILFTTEECKNIGFTEKECKVLDKNLKNKIEAACGFIDSKIIKWIGTKPVTINGNKFLKTCFIRQMRNNPPVNVELYYFEYGKKGYSITYSYRVENKEVWESKFNESINGFRLLN